MDGAGGDRCHRRVDGVGASPSTSLERRSCNLPTVSAMYGPQGWADLPDALLHSIAALLVSFPDLLAFGATCPFWRAAFATYPSKSDFSLLLPPLLIQPDVPLCSPRPRPYSSSFVPSRPCYVTNLASQNMYMCCQIPLFCHFCKTEGLPNLENFRFIGASFGHLILSNQESCLVVDVFTCVSVSPSQLPVILVDTQLCHGTLTAPLASPNSHLMVTTGFHSFFWRVGSHSWVRRYNRDLINRRLVVFKGQEFGTGDGSGLYIVHLVPHIRIQKISVDQGETLMINRLNFSQMLACGDMLLMVGCPRSFRSIRDTFHAFRLDLLTEPAKWVKVEKLENCAIFISIDDRSQALCLNDLERWGGRSNYIYSCDSIEWIACELGRPLQRGVSIPRFNCADMMKPMWVVPSIFYQCP